MGRVFGGGVGGLGGCVGRVEWVYGVQVGVGVKWDGSWDVRRGVGRGWSVRLGGCVWCVWSCGGGFVVWGGVGEWGGYASWIWEGVEFLGGCARWGGCRVRFWVVVWGGLGKLYFAK